MRFGGDWNNPETTAQAVVIGWGRSGDVVHVEKQVHLYITDRKNMFLRTGENTGWLEEDAVFYEYPDIVGTGVFGVPDKRLGEALAAILYRSSVSNLAHSQVLEFARKHLAYSKVPDHIWSREIAFSSDRFRGNLQEEIREDLLPES